MEDVRGRDVLERWRLQPRAGQHQHRSGLAPSRRSVDYLCPARRSAEPKSVTAVERVGRVRVDPPNPRKPRDEEIDAYAAALAEVLK